MPAISQRHAFPDYPGSGSMGCRDVSFLFLLSFGNRIDRCKQWRSITRFDYRFCFFGDARCRNLSWNWNTITIFHSEKMLIIVGDKERSSRGPSLSPLFTSSKQYSILLPVIHEREKYRAGKSERKGRKGKLLLLLLLFRKIARQFDAR